MCHLRSGMFSHVAIYISPSFISCVYELLFRWHRCCREVLSNTMYVLSFATIGMFYLHRAHLSGVLLKLGCITEAIKIMPHAPLWAFMGGSLVSITIHVLPAARFIRNRAYNLLYYSYYLVGFPDRCALKKLIKCVDCMVSLLSCSVICVHFYQSMLKPCPSCKSS